MAAQIIERARVQMSQYSERPYWQERYILLVILAHILPSNYIRLLRLFWPIFIV